MPDLNSHFVSRFLTRPWEFGQRRLWYYDFDRRHISHCSSRSLFAQRGSSSPEMERRLNDLVETPLSRFVQTLAAKSPSGAAEVYDWPLVRALHIILLIQAIRPSNHELHRRELRKVLHLPNEDIDQLAAASNKTYQLVRLGAHPRAPLFYPSDGVFVVPVQAGKASGRFVQLIAMPVTPLYAVLSIPRNVDTDYVLDTITVGNGGYLSNSSVGTAARRVVIHPAIVSDNDRQHIVTTLEENRARNSDNLDCACAKDDLMNLLRRHRGRSRGVGAEQQV